MSQSSSAISKKCKIVSGASRQSLMCQFIVCTHQYGYSHPETDANLLTQHPETSPQTSSPKCSQLWILVFLMDESQDITVREQVVFAVRIVHPETFEVSKQFHGFV